MNSSKPSILFWCLLLLLVNLFSCKPEEEKKVDPQKHYYYLSAEQLAKTPYFTNPLFDTLTYANTQGDTFVFAKYKVDTGFVITSDETQGSQAKNLYYYQYLRNYYHSLKGNGKFGVTHYKSLTAFYGGGKDYLQINLNGFELICKDYFIGNKNSASVFFDSLIIRSNQYFMVNLFRRDISNHSVEFFMAPKNGLVLTNKNKVEDSLILIK